MFFKDFYKLFFDILFIIIILLFLLIFKQFWNLVFVRISGNVQGRFTRALEVFISLYRETVLPNRHGQHAPRNNCSHSEPFTLLVKIISSPYFHVLSICRSTWRLSNFVKKNIAHWEDPTETQFSQNCHKNNFLFYAKLFNDPYFAHLRKIQRFLDF